LTQSASGPEHPIPGAKLADPTFLTAMNMDDMEGTQQNGRDVGKD